MNADDYMRAKTEALRIYHDLSDDQMRQLNDSVLHLSIAHASKMLSEPEDALRFATEATVLFKEDPQPYMVLGELLMAADDHAKAEQRFRQAIMHHENPACEHPLNAQNVYFTLCCLGVSLTNQGKYSEAEFFLSKAAREDPCSTLALRHLVDVYHFQGNASKALLMAERVCALDPDDEEMQRRANDLQEDMSPEDYDRRSDSGSESESGEDVRPFQGGPTNAGAQRRAESPRSVSVVSDAPQSLTRPVHTVTAGSYEAVGAGPPTRKKPSAKREGWFAFCCFEREEEKRGV
jgi:tetratricopeptide (TPR) repeat protein